MTREELEFVRQSYETFIAEGLESALSYFHPEGEFVSRFGAIEGRTYEGYDGVREYVADIAEAWDAYERDLVELIDAGEAALAVLDVKARSRVSGVDVERRIGLAYWLRDGLIARMVSYPSVEEAREAVGL